MKTRTKKITSLLLILLGFSPLLVVIVYEFAREEIRSRMREKLDSTTELVYLTIPEKDVIWMDDHEIWHNDHMFDISSKKLENGVYTFTGLYDEEETELVNAKKESDEKNQEEQTLLIRFFKWVQNSYREKAIEPAEPLLTNTNHYIDNETTRNLLYLEVRTPPPRKIPVHFSI